MALDYYEGVVVGMETVKSKYKQLARTSTQIVQYCSTSGFVAAACIVSLCFTRLQYGHIVTGVAYCREISFALFCW